MQMLMQHANANATRGMVIDTQYTQNARRRGERRSSTPHVIVIVSSQIAEQAQNGQWSEVQEFSLGGWGSDRIKAKVIAATRVTGAAVVGEGRKRKRERVCVCM